MSKSAQELADKIRRLTQPADITLDGEVTAVDESDYTCTVKLANELELTPVQLKALKGASDTVVVVPQVGSDVQVINIGDPDWMVISCDVVDKVIIKAATKVQLDCDDVVLNGGGNNGLVIVGQVQENLDTLKDYIKNTLEPAIGSGLAAVGVGSAANGGTGKTTFDGATAAAVINFVNMENTKVKH